MSSDIVVIGSGFAARQLIKNIRSRDKNIPIRLIAADSCDEYSKPELSHIFTLGQCADDLTRQTAAEWAENCHVMLHPHTRVNSINSAAHLISTTAGEFSYAKLVLATGAEAILPDIAGCERMFTLNSLHAFRQCEATLGNAREILLIGGGLIGTELAMDVNRAGRRATLVDRSASLLSALLPPEISARLQYRMMNSGVQLMLKTDVTEVTRHGDSLRAAFSNGHQQHFDAVICAIGLRPDVSLAQKAGLEVRHGIVVNDALETSAPDIFALGDCAEIRGKFMPYLQPATLAAVALARNLTGEATKIVLPVMLIKVKTPDMPLHLAGDLANPSLKWDMNFSPSGIIAKGCDDKGELRAFVVSEDHMKLAFSMLREVRLPTY